MKQEKFRKAILTNIIVNIICWFICFLLIFFLLPAFVLLVYLIPTAFIIAVLVFLFTDLKMYKNKQFEKLYSTKNIKKSVFVNVFFYKKHSEAANEYRMSTKKDTVVEAKDENDNVETSLEVEETPVTIPTNQTPVFTTDIQFKSTDNFGKILELQEMLDRGEISQETFSNYMSRLI